MVTLAVSCVLASVCGYVLGSSVTDEILASRSPSASPWALPDSRILRRRIPRLISAIRAALWAFSRYAGISDISVRSTSSLVNVDLSHRGASVYSTLAEEI